MAPAEVVAQSARCVHEKLRGGRSVESYRNAMTIQLQRELGANLQVKPRIDVLYDGHVLRRVLPDFVINEPHGFILQISVPRDYVYPGVYDKSDAIDCAHQLALPAYSIEFGTNECRVIRQC